MNKLSLQLVSLISAVSFSSAAMATELLNLVTSDTGMHRITYEELLEQGADLNGVNVRRLGLSVNGEPVQVFAKGQDSNRRRFGPSGYLEFYAEGADSLYTEDQVFTVHYLSNADLRNGRRQLIRSQRNNADRTQAGSDTYTHTTVVSENNTYSFVAPSATDPWHFGTTFSVRPTPVYTFELENVKGGSAVAEIDAEIYGFVDFPIEGNDHDYALQINGVVLGDQQFDGHAITHFTAENVAVNDGENTVQYTYRPVADIPFDRIALNTLTVKYPRSTEADKGYLEGWFDADQAQVTGVGNRKARVYRKDADGEIRRITGTANRNGATVFSTGGQAGHYIVVSQTANPDDPEDTDWGFKKPEVRALLDDEDIKTGQAEYLIIAHSSLMGEQLDELVSIRSAEYSVKVVDVTQVYAQFGHHTVGSDGIEAYVAHAVANMGTRYVVLVGNDSYDYKNHQFESVSLMPTKYVVNPTGGLNITQSPSDAAYGDVNDDGIPDVAVGRISARTPEEVGFVVNKIKAYQAREGYVGRILVAADKDDLGSGVNFTKDAQDLVAAMPNDWRASLREDFRAYPEVDGHQAAHEKLIRVMNQGVSVVSYIGHSSQYTWAYTTPPMLTVRQVPNLTNVGKPMVLTQWGCWNTYYVDPNGNTMGDLFLVGGEHGAVTVLGASTLTSSAGERALGIELNQRIFNDGVTLGDAVIAAKKALAEDGGFQDIQLGWQILGDPAVRINP